MSRNFTGRHMTLVLVGAFGVVIAVNLFMASLAVGGFSGVVVDNSYVASQRFNGWLREARQQQALGWSARAIRLQDGRVAIMTSGVPKGAEVSASLRRPLGKPETVKLAFGAGTAGRFVSQTQVASGRWTARLTIEAGDRRWAWEGPLA